VFPQRLFSGVGQGISSVARLYLFTALGILGSVCLCLPLHPLYLFLTQSAGSSDSYLLLLASAFIMSPNTNDTIGIDIKADLNLGHTSWRRQDAIEHKLPQGSVISRHRSLPLEDVNLDTGLTISGSAENLALSCRDGGIAGDERGCHATKGLNAQSEGSNFK